MIAVLLPLVIVAIVLGIAGAAGKGLVYLLLIGIVLFPGALLLRARRAQRRARPSWLTCTS
jgi:hypothetical protein